jgi:hypothetical protein
MPSNKIRFRKKIISPDNIDQYRDYTRLVERHERYMKLRTLYRFLIYFAVTTILLVLILVAIWRVRDEQYRRKVHSRQSTVHGGIRVHIKTGLPDIPNS